MRVRQELRSRPRTTVTSMGWVVRSETALIADHCVVSESGTMVATMMDYDYYYYCGQLEL